jgi:methionine synthase I (cobalamin-dependent)
VRPDVRRALASGLILADGAMGTELAGRGMSPPFERFNLERPAAVLDVHRAHRAAGARLLRSNTFLARTPEEARAGARLAREAAGEDLWVAGAAGPGMEHVEALAEAGCDLLILETFTDAAALRRALARARATGLPTVAQAAGPPPAGLEADVVGVNCVAAEEALGLVDALLRAGVPAVSAFPHAGLPGALASPGAFAAAGARLAALGVRILGGCCNAGPGHVRALAEAVGC